MFPELVQCTNMSVVNVVGRRKTMTKGNEVFIDYGDTYWATGGTLTFKDIGPTFCYEYFVPVSMNLSVNLWW